MSFNNEVTSSLDHLNHYDDDYLPASLIPRNDALNIQLRRAAPNENLNTDDFRDSGESGYSHMDRVYR